MAPPTPPEPLPPPVPGPPAPGPPVPPAPAPPAPPAGTTGGFFAFVTPSPSDGPVQPPGPIPPPPIDPPAPAPEPPPLPPAPPPPPAPIDPPPGILTNSAGKSILNAHCASWRDLRTSWATTKQLNMFAKCMGQDCVQSLEATNACRFMDDNQLCYAYPTAQQWCADNPGGVGCTDGGADWAAAPFGTASATGAAANWTPRSQVPVDHPEASDPTTFDCACMKDCACSTSKCYCARGGTSTSVGAGTDFANIKIQGSSYSAKMGECTCSCGGVMGV